MIRQCTLGLFICLVLAGCSRKAQIPVMDEEQFWTLINPISALSFGEKENALRKALATLTPENIILFQEIWDQKMVESYTWDLWGAAFIIGSGCDDDAFINFRSSLILMGRAVFENAVNDPDTLAVVAGGGESGIWFYEGYQYMAGEAYGQKTGQELPESNVTFPDEPDGESWSEGDLEGRFPALYEAFNG
jgi:hypothetical protein